jgi:hypothetical protein
MHIQKLLTYSSERYYLLSEIEQRAEFVFTDEPDSKAKERQSTQNPRIDSVYLLWDSNTDIALLKINIKKILELYPSCQSRCLFVVECLVADEHNFDAVVKDQLDGLFTWAQKAHPEVFIFVGVADKPSGTPGLEKLEEVMRGAVAVAPSVAGHFRVIGMTRRDCLGHDPDREPDADSNVFQVLCCRSVEESDEWLRQFYEYVRQLYSTVPANPSAALTGPEAAGFKAWGAVSLVTVVAAAVVAVGFVMQYVNTKQLEPSQE